MQSPGQDRYFAEITASAATLAGIAASTDNELPVPSCPDWSLGQLAAHLGQVHRWAAEIVRTRSAEAIPRRAVPDMAYPADPAGRAAWLTAGADRLIDIVAAAGEEPVWAFQAGVPASFWARRQAHETMVHRADAELATGRDVVLDQQLAADAVDEWLSMVARGRGDSRPLPDGKRLGLTATVAADPHAAATWLVTGTGDGITLARDDGPGAGPPDAAARGPAGRLLLVLLRRADAADPAIGVTGDAGLLAGWLAATPF